MNIFKAIRYVEKTKTKMRTQEGHELKYSRKYVRLLCPETPDVYTQIYLTDIPRLEHLDFEPVIDWSKVKWVDNRGYFHQGMPLNKGR